MKKIIILMLAIFAVNTSCLAAITPQESTADDYITNHGYSPEMVKILNLQKAQYNNTQSTYVKPRENWENINYPKWCTTNRIKYIRNFFMYIDPGLDTGDFGTHNTNYSNSWQDL